MDPRHFNTSVNTSFMQKHTVNKAFQSLLEESVIYEGPIIHKRFHPNQTDLNLSSARADLFSSIKNKTFDMGWRQEVAKKSMSFTQNQSHLSNFAANYSSRKNVSKSHNVGRHVTRVVSKKPTLSPHREAPTVLLKKLPTKISSFKIPPPIKNPSLKILQHEAKKLEKHLSETNKHNLRSRAKDLVANLHPRVLVKDIKKEGMTKHRSTLTTKDTKHLSKQTPQKKNLVQNMQSHETVGDVQKRKLRSFTTNQTDKCNVQSTSSSKTAASEVSAVNNKRKRSSHKKSPTEPDSKRLKVQHVKKSGQKAHKPDTKVQNSETLTQKTSTKLQISPRKTRRTELRKQSPAPKAKSPSKPIPKSRITERFLDKWIVYQDENNETFIKGHVKDCSPKTFWRSTPIVRRIENNVLETQSGTKCIISGPPYASAMLSKGYTQDIINCFQNGFPIEWKSVLKGNLPSNSKITEKNHKLDEEKPRKLRDRVSNRLKTVENNVPTPETASTSVENDVPSEKPLQEESSLSADEISNSSDDDELTEMESTATDLLNLLEFRPKNNAFNYHLNNFENSSVTRDPNSCFVKLKGLPQQNVYMKNNESKGGHDSRPSHHKKQITEEETKMKKQRVEECLDSESSEESSLSDSDYIDKPKKNDVAKKKSASPSKTSQSLKRKHLSPTKSVSPKKQKSHNPVKRESQSPSKRSASGMRQNSPKKAGNTKMRVTAVSNTDTRSTNDEMSSEDDEVPVTKSSKSSKKSGRNSSSQNKTKETRNRSSKSTAGKKKKEIWSNTALKNLRRAMSKLSTSDPMFWSKVAQKVGKSVAECKNQYYNNGLPSDKEAQNAKKKKSQKSPQPQIDELRAKDPEYDFDDDFFESENVKKNTQNLNFNPEDKLEDIFGDLCAFTPRPSSDYNFQSSMSKFFLTPVSERHTPASSFSDMEVKIDWDNATHCVKNFKKNQKKGAGRLKHFNKKLDLQNLQGPSKIKPLDLVTELNKLNEIPTTSKNNALDDSDQLSYFSDSDVN